MKVGQLIWQLLIIVIKEWSWDQPIEIECEDIIDEPTGIVRGTCSSNLRITNTPINDYPEDIILYRPDNGKKTSP